MNYGLPYMGSKSKIVKEFFHIFPKARHFYDMFGGGGAVTHYITLTGRYQHVHYNELSAVSDMFRDAVDGKFADEKRWITRDEFNEKKYTDPFIGIVWSFGNTFSSYIYAREIEAWKYALHCAIINGDTSEFEKFGIKTDASVTDIERHKQNYKMKYMNWYMHEILNLDIDAEADSAEIDRLAKEKGCLASIQKLRQFEDMDSIQHWLRIKRIRTLGRLKAYENGLGRGEADDKRLIITRMDYRDVPIEKDSVIYCDPPYIGTGEYVQNENSFDHKAFYDWCESLDQPIFISEYYMPEDRFDCVYEMEHRSTVCATENIAVIEKIFVPKRQTEKLTKRLSLF